MDEDRWQDRLRVKAQKIRVWFEERAEKYQEEGYCFLPACLTFRDWKEYREFEKRGGRRRFIQQWKEISKGEIIDYVVVMEFQQRGVPHLHYLLVIERDAWLELPDKVPIYQGLGLSTLGKRIKNLKGAKKYLEGYIKKMTQTTLEQYKRLKKELRGIKDKVRLYDFGRGRDKRCLFTALGKGWFRNLYWKFFKGRFDWKFDTKLRFLSWKGLKIKDVWETKRIDKGIEAFFKGFLLEYRVDGYKVWFEVESLEDLRLWDLEGYLAPT